MKPSLRFVSAGAAHALVSALAAREAVAIDGAFGAVGTMLAAFRSGEACDVVILTKAQIAALAAEGLAVAGTATDLGAVPTAIAVRAGDAPPDVSSEDKLRSALRAADAVFFPDPTKATAGIHFANVIERLGLRGELAQKTRTFPNGATAMRTMAAASGHPIGCTQSTEILATSGVRLVASLPAGFELETVYTAAVSASARDAEAARRFVRALGDESSRGLRERAGFQA